MNREMGLSLRSWVSDIAIPAYDPRGARHWGVSSRRKLVFGRLVEILTMMQSCASAAKLRAAGPILSVGILCHVSCRFPPPRIVNRQSALNASASAE